jgi:hypothetical protein
MFWILYLHPQSTRGTKILTVSEFLDSTFRESIDERTSGFKGHIIFKCYNPQKPSWQELPIFSMVDSSSTGIFVLLRPTMAHPPPQPELSLTRIILYVCTRNESGKWCKQLPCTQRYYTGIELAMDLVQIGYHLTGTIQPRRRGLPNTIRKRGEMKAKMHEMVAYTEDDSTGIPIWKRQKAGSYDEHLAQYQHKKN